MSDKDEKPQEVTTKTPPKDVTGKEISDETLDKVAGGRSRMAECTTNANTLDMA